MWKILKHVLYNGAFLVVGVVWLLLILYFLSLLGNDFNQTFDGLGSFGQWRDTITNNFSLVQTIGYYTLIGSSFLLILTVYLQYYFAKIPRFNKRRVMINLPLVCVSLSGIAVSIIIMLVTLV